MRSPQESNTRLEKMTWRIWNIARRKNEAEEISFRSLVRCLAFVPRAAKWARIRSPSSLSSHVAVVCTRTDKEDRKRRSCHFALAASIFGGGLVAVRVQIGTTIWLTNSRALPPSTSCTTRSMRRLKGEVCCKRRDANKLGDRRLSVDNGDANEVGRMTLVVVLCASASLSSATRDPMQEDQIFVFW